MNINLPFLPEFREAMLSGRKVCTSRTRKFGKAGDRFKAFGEEFEINRIDRWALSAVAKHLFRQEGFDYSILFIGCWVKLHPRKKYDEDKMVWVHFFRRVK
jgi:hypothetical protein